MAKQKNIRSLIDPLIKKRKHYYDHVTTIQKDLSFINMKLEDMDKNFRSALLNRLERGGLGNEQYSDLVKRLGYMCSDFTDDQKKIITQDLLRKMRDTNQEAERLDAIITRTKKVGLFLRHFCHLRDRSHQSKEEKSFFSEFCENLMQFILDGKDQNYIISVEERHDKTWSNTENVKFSNDFLGIYFPPAIDIYFPLNVEEIATSQTGRISIAPCVQYWQAELTIDGRSREGKIGFIAKKLGEYLQYAFTS